MPARYTFGNAGRNSLEGTGYASLDVSLTRRLALGRSRAAVVEVQAFNALNRVNYNQPEAFADEAATFGRIVSAQPARQMQLAVRLEF